MLGAVHGLEWIPAEWLEVLEHRDELMSLGEKLHEINARYE